MKIRNAAKEVAVALADAPELLRVKEVAEITRVHERTVRRALADGRLSAIRRGPRTLLIPKSALLKYLTEGVS